MKTKKFCIIGCGYFGYNLALNLHSAGAEVIAIDKREDIIEKLSERLTHVVAMDTTDKKAMHKLGLNDMDAVIVAIGEGFEDSLLTTAILQELGVKKIYNRVVSDIHERLLKLMGITDLLVPESEASEHLASRLMITNLLELFKITENYGIFEIKAPAFAVNKSLIELNLRQKYKLNLVTIIRNETSKNILKSEISKVKKAMGVPEPDVFIEKDDILVLSGFNKDFHKFNKLFDDNVD